MYRPPFIVRLANKADFESLFALLQASIPACSRDLAQQGWDHFWELSSCFWSRLGLVVLDSSDEPVAGILLALVDGPQVKRSLREPDGTPITVIALDYLRAEHLLSRQVLESNLGKRGVDLLQVGMVMRPGMKTHDVVGILVESLKGMRIRSLLVPITREHLPIAHEFLFQSDYNMFVFRALRRGLDIVTSERRRGYWVFSHKRTHPHFLGRANELYEEPGPIPPLVGPLTDAQCEILFRAGLPTTPEHAFDCFANPEDYCKKLLGGSRLPLEREFMLNLHGNNACARVMSLAHQYPALRFPYPQA